MKHLPHKLVLFLLLFSFQIATPQQNDQLEHKEETVQQKTDEEALTAPVSETEEISKKRAYQKTLSNMADSFLTVKPDSKTLSGFYRKVVDFNNLWSYGKINDILNWLPTYNISDYDFFTGCFVDALTPKDTLFLPLKQKYTPFLRFNPDVDELNTFTRIWKNKSRDEMEKHSSDPLSRKVQLFYQWLDYTDSIRNSQLIHERDSLIANKVNKSEYISSINDMIEHYNNITTAPHPCFLPHYIDTYYCNDSFVYIKEEYKIDEEPFPPYFLGPIGKKTHISTTVPYYTGSGKEGKYHIFLLDNFLVYDMIKYMNGSKKKGEKLYRSLTNNYPENGQEGKQRKKDIRNTYFCQHLHNCDVSTHFYHLPVIESMFVYTDGVVINARDWSSGFSAFIPNDMKHLDDITEVDVWIE
ncbi:MAG: hypothetical protein IKP37_05370 [Paludibacteraceae bacterium]|nr:hypothetical protein [Paludibacteraceae bacterium]